MESSPQGQFKRGKAAMILAALLVASLLNKGGGGEMKFVNPLPKTLLSVIHKPYSIFAKRLGMSSIPCCNLLGCNIVV